MAATERAACGAVERLRLVGSGAGIGLVAFFGSRLLVTPPRITIDALFVLGGLLMVVMVMVLVLTGAGIGAGIGERRVAGRWHRTFMALEHDVGLRADLQRWRALVRSLAQHHDALGGGLRGLPFRCEVVGGGDDLENSHATAALAAERDPEAQAAIADDDGIRSEPSITSTSGRREPRGPARRSP